VTPTHAWKGIERVPVLDEAGITFVRGLVRIPYFARGGREHNAKVFPLQRRRWCPSSWWERSGLPVIPFGLQLLPRTASAALRSVLLVAEGESDALALGSSYAEIVGHPFIDSIHVLGLPGASSWQSDWGAFLEPFPFIYVIGDGDEAGQRMIASVKADVPWARPVRLPSGADARSIIQSRGCGALDPFLGIADDDAALVAGVFGSESVAECAAAVVRTRGAFRG
jgi:hypothetical protein